MRLMYLPATDHGRQIYLEIAGAMAYSAVWRNGRFVGGWPYGYASYHLHRTPYLTPGSHNTLAIRVDNPPDSSRWYPGGGIYRNVWLLKTSPVHVEPWGTFVTTPEVSAESATIDIKTRIANHSTGTAQVRVATQIFKLSADGQPEGAALATSSAATLTVAPGATTPNAAARDVGRPVRRRGGHYARRSISLETHDNFMADEGVAAPVPLDRAQPGAFRRDGFYVMRPLPVNAPLPASRPPMPPNRAPWHHPMSRGPAYPRPAHRT
jgi:hypothetical protein